MKIIIGNTKFDYNIGCKLLKAKYGDTPFENLEDIWDDIVPITFEEIATQITNLEQRRVAIGCLGLEKIVKEVNPILMNSETLKKQTTWVTPTGEIETHKFNDTYELYKVKPENWASRVENTWGLKDVYFVKCCDTSTDREYFIWVDGESVARVNGVNKSSWVSNSDIEKINAIQAIAWTFQTNVPLGAIEKIIRQGDCILIKHKGSFKKTETVRHLTEKEYRELLVAES
jgi:hypothetical protein